MVSWNHLLQSVKSQEGWSRDERTLLQILPVKRVKEDSGSFSSRMISVDGVHTHTMIMTNPFFYLQMLEVIFHHNLCTRYERIGRNMFFSQGDFGKSYNLGGGKEILSGLFGSLRPVAWKDNSMLLNVDGKWKMIEMKKKIKCCINLRRFTTIRKYLKMPWMIWCMTILFVWAEDVSVGSHCSLQD